MKKFIVNSEILLRALQIAGKALTKNPVVSILENFLFNIRNGVLTVSAGDLQSTFKVSFKIDANPGEQFRAVVPAEIMKYLAKLESQPITFCYYNESYSIEILDEDNARAKYSSENHEDFPIHPQTDLELFTITNTLFDEFKDLLTYTSKDELRPAMTGIYFNTHENQFNMTATNGHRLKVVNVPELNGRMPVVEIALPNGQMVMTDSEDFANYFKKAKKISDKYGYSSTNKENHKAIGNNEAWLESVEIFVNETYFILPSKPAKILSDLKFGTAKKPVVEAINVMTNEKRENVSFLFSYECFDCELITRSIDERFPQYWNVIPTQTKTRYTVDKEKFLKVIDKASLFANRTTHQIRLGLNGKNKISAEDLDFSNEFCAEIGGAYEGEPIEIGFNAEFLKMTCANFNDGFVLEMSAPNKAAVIRQGNWLALVMPVMLNEYN